MKMKTTELFRIALASLISLALLGSSRRAAGEPKGYELWKRKLNNVEEQLKDIQNQISDLDTASESIALSDLKLLLTYRYFRAHDLSRKTSSFSIATSSEKVFYDLMLLEQSEIIENLIRGEDKNLEIERLEKLTTEFATAFPIFETLTTSGAISAALFYCRSFEYIEDSVTTICRSKTEKSERGIDLVERIFLEIYLQEQPIELDVDDQNRVKQQLISDKVRPIISLHKQSYDRRKAK